MTRAFVYAAEFDRIWFRDLKLTDDDLIPIEEHLLKNPEAGVVIKGTDELRKLMWTFQNKGKRGELRILYVDIIMDKELAMITLFPKIEKENLTENEKKAIKEFISEEFKYKNRS